MHPTLWIAAQLAWLLGKAAVFVGRQSGKRVCRGDCLLLHEKKNGNYAAWFNAWGASVHSDVVLALKEGVLDFVLQRVLSCLCR